MRGLWIGYQAVKERLPLPAQVTLTRAELWAGELALRWLWRP